MVGTPGFEPGTSCTPSKRATRLRHVPNLLSILRRRQRWQYVTVQFQIERPRERQTELKLTAKEAAKNIALLRCKLRLTEQGEQLMQRATDLA
jgi:hypothetical protein